MNVWKFLDFSAELLQLLVIKLLCIALQIVSFPLEFISLTHEYLTCGESQHKAYNSVLITGASSGIGLHFALKISSQQPPPQRLGLIARRSDKLKMVKQQCIQNGCNNVEIYSWDVTDQHGMKDILQSDDKRAAFDLVFANAGYRSDLSEKMVSGAYKTYNVNVMGVLNTVLPVIPSMIRQRKGQIVINASIAGLTPHQLFPFYSASKHALVSLSENLRCLLHEYDIGVSVILPGFIETHLVSHLDEHKLPMLGKMNGNQAIQKIADVAQHNTAMAPFPFIANLLASLYESLSPRMKQIVLDRNVIDRIIGWYHRVPQRAWN